MPDFNILKECGINNIHSQINDLQPRLLILLNFWCIPKNIKNQERSNIILQTLQLKLQRGMCLFIIIIIIIQEFLLLILQELVNNLFNLIWVISKEMNKMKNGT